ncbi:MAG: hypothetical protein LBG22_01740, partial [Treponema sp.]|nr:hypothetical protein [Treponema sp.]
MNRPGCLVLAVLVSLALSGCASAPRQEASGRITETEGFPSPAFLNTSPRGGELFLIGVAGHRRNREEAIQ